MWRGVAWRKLHTAGVSSHSPISYAIFYLMWLHIYCCALGRLTEAGNASQRCLVYGNPQAVIILFFFPFFSPLIFFISLLTALGVTILEGTAGPSLRTPVTDKRAWLNQAILVPVKDLLMSEYLNRWRKCQQRWNNKYADDYMRVDLE